MYYWVFVAAGASAPTAVFSSEVLGREWIAQQGASGILTAYPRDQGAFDWCVATGRFQPKRDDQRSPAFVASFTSAKQPHHHFVDGQEPAADAG